MKQLEQEKKLPYLGTVGVFRHEDEAFLPRFQFAPLYSGRYRLRVSLWSFFWDKGDVKPNPRTEAASLIAEGHTLGYFDAPSLKPTVHEVEVWLNAGEMLRFNAASLWPTRVSERPGRAAEYQGPGMAVDWLDVEGPLLDQWPPAGHRACTATWAWPRSPRARRQRATRGCRNARRSASSGPAGRNRCPASSRRPSSSPPPPRPTPGGCSMTSSSAPSAATWCRKSRNATSACSRRSLAAGAGFEEAMRTAYKAVLCSPEFLFLKEPRRQALDHWALASRLSYFLWNSMPDDELLDLAQKGKLHDTATPPRTGRADAEGSQGRPVRRTTSPTSGSTCATSTPPCPDRRLYPEFRPILRDAMLAETRAFFR